MVIERRGGVREVLRNREQVGMDAEMTGKGGHRWALGRGHGVESEGVSL